MLCAATCSSENGTVLCLASQQGRIDEVRMLLRQGRLDVNQTSTFRFTPLFAAAKRGHAAVARMFLDEQGTDANKGRACDGATPLYIASQNGHLEIVRMLLTHSGVDAAKGRRCNGTAPVHIASKYGHAEVVRALIENGGVDANQRKTDCSGDTPLAVARQYGQGGVISVLLHHGATSSGSSNITAQKRQVVDPHV